MKSSHFVVAVAALAASVALAPDRAPAGIDPEPFRFHPAGGAHWKGKAGLEDAKGNAAQAVVYRSVRAGGSGFRTIGIVTGFEGRELSTLGGIGLATDSQPGGKIVPCPKIAYETPGGLVAEVRIGLGDMRRVGTERGPGGTFGIYEYSGPFPEGSIVSIELEVMVAEDVGTSTVAVDDLVVGPKVWTSAADNGAR